MPPRSSIALALAAVATLAAADESADKEREDMQRRLNEEVMSSKFDPGDVNKAQAYAEEAKKQNVVPVAAPPSFWVPGWTCANFIGSPYYSYPVYRNCIYYHYYYRRYW